MTARKVLIVEDDPVARQILQAALRANGFQVFMAPDALGAVSQARTHKPDLVILDLGLPAGGGFSVLQRLNTLPALAGTPVLIVSGQDRAQNEERAISAGATAYLQKPASPDQVLAEVRRILDGSPSPFSE